MALTAGLVVGPTAFADSAHENGASGFVGRTDAAISYAAEAAMFKDQRDGRTRIYSVDAILYRHASTARAYARAFVALCPVQTGVCPVIRGSARLTRIPLSDFAVDPLLRTATLRAHLGSRSIGGVWTAKPVPSDSCSLDPVCNVTQGVTGAGGAPYLCPPGLLAGAVLSRGADARVGMFGRTFTLNGLRYNQFASLDAIALAEANGSYDEGTGYCRG